MTPKRLALGEGFTAGSRSISVGIVGLGPIGQEIARVVARKPWVRISAAVDTNPDLAGESLAQVAGFGPAGIDDPDVRISGSLDAECDVVAHATVSALSAAAPQLEAVVRRGVSVVSTCEELCFPLDPQLARHLDTAAREGSATVLGTGINPGFVLDSLPVALGVVCQDIEHISAVRVVDAGLRRGPLQRKVGAGLEREEWERLRDDGVIRHVGLPESARLLAAAVGWDDTEFTDELIEPVIADRDIQTEHVEVRAGQAAGVRQVVAGSRDGREVLHLELAMYVGASAPRDAVSIRGTPPVEMEIAGGVHGDRATAAVVANMLPRALAAPPGLLTMAELPIGASL